MKKRIYDGDFILTPATKPSDNSAIIVDRQNYLSAVVLLSSSNATSNNTVKVQIEHSNAADLNDAAVYTYLGENVESSVVNVADASTNLLVDLSGAKRYIRIKAVTAGSAPNYTAQFLLADAQYGDDFNE